MFRILIYKLKRQKRSNTLTHILFVILCFPLEKMHVGITKQLYYIIITELLINQKLN
jgi:hypothetical protein